MGVGKGVGGPCSPALDLEIFSTKCYLRSFEWEKSSFTTFGLPLEKFKKNPLVPPLENIRPTPMVITRQINTQNDASRPKSH